MGPDPSIRRKPDGALSGAADAEPRVVAVDRSGVASFDLLGPLRVLVVAIFIAWLPWRRIGLKRWTFSGYPVLLGVVVFVVWVSLVQPDSADASNVIPGLATLSPAGRAVWLSARIFGAAVVAPIVEELAFRGFFAPPPVSTGLRPRPLRDGWPSGVALARQLRRLRRHAPIVHRGFACRRGLWTGARAAWPPRRRRRRARGHQRHAGDLRRGHLEVVPAGVTDAGAQLSRICFESTNTSKRNRRRRGQRINQPHRCAARAISI